jgi:hypothetical protein
MVQNVGCNGKKIRTLMARTPQTLMISFVQELISISRLFHVKDSYIPFQVLEIYIFFPLQPTFWTINNGSNSIDLLSSSSFDACICVSKCGFMGSVGSEP